MPLSDDRGTPAEQRATRRRRRISTRYWDAYARRTMPTEALLIGGTLLIVLLGAGVALIAFL
ncbi:hypothetical protein [Pseudoclavibacter sp. RFBA6]|uniref:hypothetical protein n=1 Tax=Pseudoclavibacter sp. RFBA6 TaxID=2080573 RepID=UPI000CE8BC4E|nr:hypothetical protein [Pseudoclavibacter sp. RFBA6]PPG42053.1 hypothetical protein C5C17_03545 [Pseudoclavibacter sp. RFBA6]